MAVLYVRVTLGGWFECVEPREDVELRSWEGDVGSASVVVLVDMVRLEDLTSLASQDSCDVPDLEVLLSRRCGHQEGQILAW